MKELGNFVYQIYPKSFNDTTGSGVGDINGVIEKIPYISGLGFDYIWLTPMYISPQKDNGYDVANYYEIDPLFGDMNDFEILVEIAEKNNLKIMMDLVFNHTSDQHEWFQKALKGEKKYQDYYIFRNKDEITTWESKFGGSSWQYVEHLDKYYLHLFDVSQPDLNWENEEVRKSLYQIVNFWIDKGVKGFRFDVINLISKKYPLQNGTGDGRDQYTDGPRIHEFLKELRSQTFATNTDFLTVGEMSSTSINQCLKYASPKRDELDTVFHFHHLKVDYENAQKWSKDYFDFEMLKTLMKDWQIEMDKNNVVDTLFWSNHDQPRVASRFIQADSEIKQLRKNKTLAALMYLQKGICYIYQGEEIGMENLNITSIDDLVDVESINYYNLEKNYDSEYKLAVLNEKSRDHARTPIQWNDSQNAGFTTGIPWIGVNNKYKVINVEAQINDENSTYSFYKKLIDLKKNDDVFKLGKITFEDHSKLFIYERELENKKYKVICNLFNENIEYNQGKDSINNIIINNGVAIEEKCLNINAFSCIVFEVK